MGNFYTISVKVYIPFHILFTLFPCFFSLSSVTTQAFNLLYYSCLFRRRTCINFNFHAVFLLSVPRFRNVGKICCWVRSLTPLRGFVLIFQDSSEGFCIILLILFSICLSCVLCLCLYITIISFICQYCFSSFFISFFFEKSRAFITWKLL